MPNELAVDFSTDILDPALIKAAGYSGVVRYLAPLPNPKVITADQVASLHAHGLWILLVWESTAGRALGGGPVGRSDGLQAAQVARALGYPPSCPIFWAVDFEPTPAQMPLILAYGAAFEQSWLGGPYGGIDTVDAVKSPWRWQTMAWSRGKVSTSAALYQRTSPTRSLRGSFDEDVVLNPNLPVWKPNTIYIGEPVVVYRVSDGPDAGFEFAFFGPNAVHLDGATVGSNVPIPVSGAVFAKIPGVIR